MASHTDLASTKPPRLFDIAVTATADDFHGIYRGKKYHEPDFDAVLDRASTAGVQKVLLTGMSPSDVVENYNIAKSRPGQCRVTVGVHPYFAAEPGSSENGEKEYWMSFADTVDRLLAEQPRLIAAYGELGLDYDHLEKASEEVQIRTFKKQLDLYVSRHIDLPLFLHCRAAFEDFVDVLGPYLDQIPRKGVVHSFVGSPSEMHTLVEMGLDVSVNGFSFRSEESIQMVKEIPLERLQIETDSPWGEIGATSQVAKEYLVGARELPGAAKKRNKFELGCRVKERNESCSLEWVAMVVAGIKGVKVDVITDAAWENSCRMFEFK